MRIYTDKNVYDAALERIRCIFSEFGNVVVNISGGKDSTVVFYLSMMVAHELGRIPLPVMFIDQEAEWEVVIDVIRDIMYREDVKPYWLQVPFRLTNATSTVDQYLNVWDEHDKDNWLRAKDPIAIHENRYGTDRFHPLFTNFLKVEYPRAKVCYIAGVRCEESPARQLTLSTKVKYKHIPWGRVHDRQYQQYAFYPIYDWTWRDVWKAIYDHGWKYSKLYDYQYQYGLPIKQMRVSSVHHENSLVSLFYMQEIEPGTFDRLSRRLRGVNAAGHLGDDFLCPDKLPYMFKDWREYRDYLLENLIDDENIRSVLRKEFHAQDVGFVPAIHGQMLKRHINAIMTKDIDLTRVSTWAAAHLNWRVKNG